MINRRDFLKAAGLALAGPALGRCLTASTVSGRLPNVIYILADDLGWAELGCYGNKFNETPNLDKLAAQGMKFTDAYAAAPVCSPYRAALMTGQYPPRTGITDYLRPADNNHLALSYTTLAEMFKSRGYVTAIAGKWHLSGYSSHGAQEEALPDKHGFDEVMISEKTGIAGGSYFHPYERIDATIPRKLPGETEYLTDRLNIEAIEFIQRNKDKSFFLYKSHYAVHTRLKGRPDLVSHFESKPDAGKGPSAKKNNPHLAAQLKVIDDGLGMIITKLEQLGLTENTIIIFTGDNGGESRVTSNAPLRAGKSTLYEGGIREPLLVKWPGTVAPATVCSTPVMNIDFYPTFARIIDAAINPSQPVDGISILPLLRGRTINRDTLYWHYPLKKPHFLGGRSSGAIRMGHWKLIEFFDDRHLELYNLEDDIAETNNLAARHPEKLKQLHTRLTRWRQEVNAKIPTGQSPATIRPSSS